MSDATVAPQEEIDGFEVKIVAAKLRRNCSCVAVLKNVKIGDSSFPQDHVL